MSQADSRHASQSRGPHELPEVLQHMTAACALLEEQLSRVTALVMARVPSTQASAEVRTDVFASEKASVAREVSASMAIVEQELRGIREEMDWLRSSLAGHTQRDMHRSRTWLSGAPAGQVADDAGEGLGECQTWLPAVHTRESPGAEGEAEGVGESGLDASESQGSAAAADGDGAVATESAANWRLLQASDLIDAQRVQQEQQRQRETFAQVRAALRRQHDCNDPGARIGTRGTIKSPRPATAVTRAPAPLKQEGLSVMTTLASLAGELLHGRWKVQIMDPGLKASDDSAQLMSCGLAAELVSQDDGPAGDHGGGGAGRTSRLPQLPRVASLVHRSAQSVVPGGGPSRDKLAAPQVAYVKRFDVDSGHLPAHVGRRGTQSKGRLGPLKESLRREETRRRQLLAEQPRILLDDLLRRPEADAPADDPLPPPLRSTAAAAVGDPAPGTATHFGGISSAVGGKAAASGEGGRSVVPAATNAVGERKYRLTTVGGRMQPSRYHAQYLKTFRKALGIPEAQLQELEQLDAWKYQLTDATPSELAQCESTARIDSADSHATPHPELSHFNILQAFMPDAVKCFYKWRLAAKHAKQSRARKEYEALLDSFNYNPPGPEEHANKMHTDHLLWAEERSLMPIILMPRRKDYGGKVVPVCSRCERIYARLELFRASAADRMLRNVRRSCSQLHVAGFTEGSLHQPSSESQLSLLSGRLHCLPICVYYI